MSNRLESILSRAYTLAAQALDNEIDTALAEEVSGECAELLAHIAEDRGAFESDEVKDMELMSLAKTIRGMA